MQKISGLLFLLGGSAVVLGILTAEIFYPSAYSISLNMISNLGSTPPPHIVVDQPSASIFDYSMMLSGILTIIGVYFLQRSLKDKFMILLLFLTGLGTLGVGIFPASHLTPHSISALLAFSSGALAAAYSFRITESPFKYLCLVLGFTSLSFLTFGIFFKEFILPVLGAGGTERWVAYPMLIWLVSFGGYLMGSQNFDKSK